MTSCPLILCVRFSTARGQLVDAERLSTRVIGVSVAGLGCWVKGFSVGLEGCRGSGKGFP